MSEQLYALVGRKQMELEQLHAEYDRLLRVLAAVVTGEIALERVHVDLSRRQWVIEEPGVSEALRRVAQHTNGAAHADDQVTGPDDERKRGTLRA